MYRFTIVHSRSSGVTSWNNLPCYIWESPWKLQSANTRHFFWEFGLEWIFPAASLLCSNSYISFLLLPKNMSLDKFGDLFYSQDELFVVLSSLLSSKSTMALMEKPNTTLTSSSPETFWRFVLLVFLTMSEIILSGVPTTTYSSPRNV